jgi:chromosome segregation ATPase
VKNADSVATILIMCCPNFYLKNYRLMAQAKKAPVITKAMIQLGLLMVVSGVFADTTTGSLPNTIKENAIQINSDRQQIESLKMRNKYCDAFTQYARQEIDMKGSALGFYLNRKRELSTQAAFVDKATLDDLDTKIQAQQKEMASLEEHIQSCIRHRDESAKNIEKILNHIKQLQVEK